MIRSFVLRAVTLACLSVSFFFVACGGGGDPLPPPFKPDDKQQQEALAKFKAASDQALAKIKQGEAPGKNDADLFRNALMLWVTANNGRTANVPSNQLNLISHLAQFAKSGIGQFKGLPFQKQLFALKNAGAGFAALTSNLSADSQVGSVFTSLNNLANNQTGFRGLMDRKQRTLAKKANRRKPNSKSKGSRGFSKQATTDFSDYHQQGLAKADAVSESSADDNRFIINKQGFPELNTLSFPQ